MVPDCRTCGACCVGLSVDVYWSDDVPLRMTRTDPEDSNRVEMRHKRGRYIGAGPCIALKTNPDKTCVCSIYARRPFVCRDFAVGGARCLELRQERGIDGPFLAPAPDRVGVEAT